MRKTLSLVLTLSAGLLSLHVINLAVCVIWYIVKTKKRKTA